MTEVFQLFGMSRSGHHAIIHWVAGHYNGNVKHYNNCQFSKLHGYQSTPYLGLYCNNIGNENISYGDGRDCIIYSFEEQFTPIDISSRHIVCIRDPYNLFASRTHKQRQIDGRSLIFYSDVLLWKLFAKEFMKSNILNSPIKINYNCWFSSPCYREKLSENFGVYTDSNLEYMPGYWGGSSFDGTNFQGKTQQMNVLDRWKHYQNDAEFINKVIKDKELEHLSELIFGKFPYITHEFS